eukprot:9575819-Alexandrium_andersonii.AAC.1
MPQPPSPAPRRGSLPLRRALAQGPLLPRGACPSKHSDRAPLRRMLARDVQEKVHLLVDVLDVL